ncbi:MAG: HypC/HybG/HupF family hydrogenase formation chaperone [Magnetovibrionaceae bacterium]
MCHALPAEVIELLEDDMARVNLGGAVKDISLGLLDDIQVGDFVIVHVGYALSKVDREEAERTLALFAEMAEAVADGEQAA